MQYGQMILKLAQFVEATNFLSANKISYSTQRTGTSTFKVTVTNA